MSAGQWAFTLFSEGRGVDVGTAGAWTAAYFAGFTAGRVALGSAPLRVPAGGLLRACIGASLLGAVLLWVDPAPAFGFVGIAILGVSLGPVFPSLVATTRQRTGSSHTSRTVGFQLAAAGAGGLLLPAGVGLALAVAGFEAIAASVVVAAALLLGLHEVAVRQGGGTRRLDIRPSRQESAS